MSHTLSADGAATAAPDDVAVARLVAAGDRRAFEQLMRRNNRRLYRLARATLRDDAEAEDALQDAYLSAYRAMSSPKPWCAAATSAPAACCANRLAREFDVAERDLVGSAYNAKRGLGADDAGDHGPGAVPEVAVNPAALSSDRQGAHRQPV